MRIQDRIAKLEARVIEELRPKKRCVPDWLQSELESQGFVFDVCGQVISAPPLSHTPATLPLNPIPIPEQGEDPVEGRTP